MIFFSSLFLEEGRRTSVGGGKYLFGLDDLNTPFGNSYGVHVDQVAAYPRDSVPFWIVIKQLLIWLSRICNVAHSIDPCGWNDLVCSRD